ncbi:MAG: hypothetical protein ABIC57_01545, partial [bacterium]
YCSCKCGASDPDNTIHVLPGGYCVCENGIASKDNLSYQQPLSETSGVAKTTICDNNTGTLNGKDGICYSHTGKCWYGAGYTSSTYGEKCFNNGTDGQWGDPTWASDNIPVPTPPGGDASGKCYSYTRWVRQGEGKVCKRTYSSGAASDNFVSLNNPVECDLGRTRSVSESLCDEAEIARNITTYLNLTVKSTCVEGELQSSSLVMPIDGKVYKCDNGSYVEASSYKFQVSGRWVWREIGIGKTCSPWWDHTYIDGHRYECDGGVWEKSDKKKSISAPEISASLYSEQSARSRNNKNICPDDAIKCYCSYKRELDFGEKILNPGEVCGYSEEIKPELTITINQLPRILASESKSSKYILDTESGLVQGITPGVYVFDYNEQRYVFKVETQNVLDNNDGVEIFSDLNSNGVFDSGVDVKISDQATLLTVKPIIEGFIYNLSEGFNFISFPFVFDNLNISMASDLLEYLHQKYDNSFYSISKFDSGRWKVVGSNGGNFDQNDFQIIPGEGYLLKAKWDLDITIYGKEVSFESSTDNAPIRFIPGWNLVGLYGSGVKPYTAQSLLEDVSDYPDVDFTAVNVSRWVEERSLYEGLQREANDEGTMQIYGLDFPISKQKGYFVKVTKGSGNWEPELR